MSCRSCTWAKQKCSSWWNVWLNLHLHLCKRKKHPQITIPSLQTLALFPQTEQLSDRRTFKMRGLWNFAAPHSKMRWLLLKGNMQSSSFTCVCHCNLSLSLRHASCVACDENPCGYLNVFDRVQIDFLTGSVNAESETWTSFKTEWKKYISTCIHNVHQI